MSEILGEHAIIDAAFEQKPLQLLNRPDRQVMFAVLRLAFSRNSQGIAAPVLHRRVEQYLADLDAVGIEGVPKFDGAIDGKLTCRRWSDALDKSRDVSTGQDYYFLSYEAGQGLSLINTMVRDRSGLSEHRVATLLDALSSLNRRINPDRGERVRILAEEIAERQAELNRLEAGGELEPVSQDYIIDGFDNLLRLFGALPGDFRRVIEKMNEQRRTIMDKFRSETGSPGEHLIEYLDMAAGLMNGTPEGRAFVGAQELLRDEQAKTSLRRNIEQLLAHPHTTDLLSESERRDLRNLLALLLNGFGSVLDARDSIHGVLREQILSHNLDQDIAMGLALRKLEQAVSDSFVVGRAHDKIACEILPHGNAVANMPVGFYDPADDLPPEPLPERTNRRPDPADVAKLFGQGGYSAPKLRRAIVAAAESWNLKDLPAGAPTPTLGDIFDTLPVDMRRPVDVLGLIHVTGGASTTTSEPTQAVTPDSTHEAEPLPDPENLAIPDDPGALANDAGPREQFRCVRTDGTEVIFLGPRIHIDYGTVTRLRKADQKTSSKNKQQTGVTA